MKRLILKPDEPKKTISVKEILKEHVIAVLNADDVRIGIIFNDLTDDYPWRVYLINDLDDCFNTLQEALRHVEENMKAPFSFMVYE